MKELAAESELERVPAKLKELIVTGLTKTNPAETLRQD